MHQFLPILRWLALGTFIIALARPQKALQEENIDAEGIDIMLVIDLSSSMLSRDFKPDRLEASKQVAADFIDRRPFDRIGLVAFAGEAFTQCPLTTDHQVLKEFLGNIKCGFLEDGTAIGMGLATAVSRIKETTSKSKVIILLTDGENNTGYVQPLQAGEIAKEFNVKVYTIGVGSRGEAMTPIGKRSDGEYVFKMSRVQINEPLLREIAQMTGGEYNRANNNQALINIYDRIDKLEKSAYEATVIKRKADTFHNWVYLGLLLLGFELLLRNTLLKNLP